MKNETARNVAARIIERWLCTGDFPGRQIEESGLTDDRGFVMESVYGVVRWKRALDWGISLLVQKMPKRAIRSFLLLGAYEILMMSGRKDYAVVNEIVEEVKSGFSGPEANFVNAVLRGLASDKHEIIAKLKSLPMGVRLSHPDILLERWRPRFGDDRTESLCEWNNSRPRVIIRVNRSKTDPSAYRRISDSVDVESEAAGLDENWLKLPHGRRVADMNGYADGLFTVMDPASRIAVDMLDPKPGEQALDACAAPGGKTFLIAERMRKQGRLTAVELHPDRLVRLRENLCRLGYDDFVHVLQNDAMELDRHLDCLFDRILLDVPCSNTGVIRRKPDVRWRFSDSRLERLIVVQSRILASCLKLLKPGGSLVYSTCSLEHEENEGLVLTCLQNEKNIRLVQEQTSFPPLSGVDGAYTALLRRE